MKKILCLILSIVTAVLLTVSVNAEEFNGADLFTVDIPEEFTQTGAAVSNFNFVNDEDDSFSVSYADNAELEEPFIVENMSNKAVEVYVSSVMEDAETAVKDYLDDFEVKATHYGKEKHKSGMTALVISLETTAKKGEKSYTYYQKMYEFSGADKKYTFTYTTSDEAEKDSFDEVFSSINIFEGQARSYFDNMWVYLAGALIICFMIFCIIRFMRRK